MLFSPWSSLVLFSLYDLAINVMWISQEHLHSSRKSVFLALIIKLNFPNLYMILCNATLWWHRQLHFGYALILLSEGILTPTGCTLIRSPTLLQCLLTAHLYRWTVVQSRKCCCDVSKRTKQVLEKSYTLNLN